ncbi:hypothetical protein QUB80_19930 [Chlorogloeopsis sp. ULAP01]|uniref:hypothetical protein n=1 Tax=Chlorogloeopsis sp. ULAP01 TaxID=3056483 RepID=UPI0025AB3395|nr:hypothetical protein [Chlorogloeopsis sp. ULAP01]MDM9382967.1 hypothetical protein [Chlorogloeopsis sp. ULAP01]
MALFLLRDRYHQISLCFSLAIAIHAWWRIYTSDRYAKANPILLTAADYKRELQNFSLSHAEHK